jgi:hypothetical protein
MAQELLSTFEDEIGRPLAIAFQDSLTNSI